MKHCRLCDDKHRKGKLCPEARRVYNYKQGLKWAREQLKDNPQAVEVLNRVLCGGPVHRPPKKITVQEWSRISREIQGWLGRHAPESGEDGSP